MNKLEELSVIIIDGIEDTVIIKSKTNNTDVSKDYKNLIAMLKDAGMDPQAAPSMLLGEFNNVGHRVTNIKADDDIIDTIEIYISDSDATIEELIAKFRNKVKDLRHVKEESITGQMLNSMFSNPKGEA